MSIKQRGTVSAKRAVERFFFLLPLVPAVLLVFSLMTQLLPDQPLQRFFGHDPALDALVGAVVGSLAMGQVFVGYLVGGELVRNGISPATATALIVSWATVGLAFLPYEMRACGNRFAITRNLLAFVSTLIIAYVTAHLLDWI
ncbi:MAG: hypothetical protein KFB96_19515 [Thiocapsa sp.]|uniref:hypothetical protein n=1 Tax=Thiocapsa sp. TaxID=2024551 RepID=UPI001BCD8506|nr:hypothetical protein [Thiocapsa sp.]QVL47839.1 MAG: hypothetical protein KFB96_19515 [Thiocapsa sp.]